MRVDQPFSYAPVVSPGGPDLASSIKWAAMLPPVRVDQPFSRESDGAGRAVPPVPWPMEVDTTSGTDTVASAAPTTALTRR